MNRVKSISLVALMAFSVSVVAQVPKTKAAVAASAQQAVQDVKPNIIKKLPEKQQAMYDQMAADLKLTDDQKNQVITLAMERAVLLNEKMKTATTDEQKSELKKASAVDYNAKIEKALGVDLAAQIKEWQKQFTIKQKAAQAK